MSRSKWSGGWPFFHWRWALERHLPVPGVTLDHEFIIAVEDFPADHIADLAGCCVRMQSEPLRTVTPQGAMMDRARISPRPAGSNLACTSFSSRMPWRACIMLVLAVFSVRRKMKRYLCDTIMRWQLSFRVSRRSRRIRLIVPRELRRPDAGSVPGVRSASNSVQPTRSIYFPYTAGCDQRMPPSQVDDGKAAKAHGSRAPARPTPCGKSRDRYGHDGEAPSGGNEQNVSSLVASHPQTQPAS